MKNPVLALVFVQILAGCQSSESVRPSNIQQDTSDIVVAVCGECHAVTANAISPRPDAPGFADIANTPALTRETLEIFLSDAHNYPRQMDVELDKADIQVIADHIMSLQSESYIKQPS